MTAGCQIPYIANALRAALHTVRGDDAKVASYLARFWGREQDRALERLFSDDARPTRFMRSSPLPFSLATPGTLSRNVLGTTPGRRPG